MRLFPGYVALLGATSVACIASWSASKVQVVATGGTKPNDITDEIFPTAFPATSEGLNGKGFEVNLDETALLADLFELTSERALLAYLLKVKEPYQYCATHQCGLVTTGGIDKYKNNFDITIKSRYNARRPQTPPPTTEETFSFIYRALSIVMLWGIIVLFLKPSYDKDVKQCFILYLLVFGYINNYMISPGGTSFRRLGLQDEPTATKAGAAPAAPAAGAATTATAAAAATSVVVGTATYLNSRSLRFAPDLAISTTLSVLAAYTIRTSYLPNTLFNCNPRDSGPRSPAVVSATTSQKFSRSSLRARKAPSSL
jgi:hypothetical protein